MAALEKALTAARDAGASVEVIDAMGRQVAALKEQRAGTRPLGARLDSARAKFNKAELKVNAAEEALAKACESLEQAKQHREDAKSALEVLLAEVPQECILAATMEQHQVLIESVQELLEKIEASRIIDPATNAPEESILQTMQRLHAIVGTSAAATRCEEEI